MADQPFAPYAPAKAVLAVITRLRERGLPDPLTSSALEQIGIPPSMTPRTMQALRFLGLVDEGGNRLPEFDNLRRAKTEEYPGQLAEIIRAAYLPVFTIVDPAVDSDTAVADAFRGYEPAAQREKMISLFRGLCLVAGLVENRPHTGGAPKRPVGGASTPRPTRSTSKKAAAAPIREQTEPDVREDEAMLDTRLITAIIQQLPRERRWSAGRRERWLSALTSAVDLLIEVGEGE